MARPARKFRTRLEPGLRPRRFNQQSTIRAYVVSPTTLPISGSVTIRKRRASPAWRFLFWWRVKGRGRHHSQGRRQDRDLVGREREFRPREHGRVFVEDLLRETEMHQTLVDREQDQRLVARGRKAAGNDNIRIDDRPDHFTPPERIRLPPVRSDLDVDLGRC